MEQYLKKGAKVYIEGALQTRKWQDQSGQDKYSTEIVLQGFNSVLTMLDGRSGGGSSGGNFGGSDEGSDFGGGSSSGGSSSGGGSRARPRRPGAAVATWTTRFRSENFLSPTSPRVYGEKVAHTSERVRKHLLLFEITEAKTHR